MSVTDPGLSAAALLLGEEAGNMLAAAMTDIGVVQRWWRSQIRHVRGRQIVVRYGVEVCWPDGRTTTETLVAEQSHAAPPEGTTVLQPPDGDPVWLWRYPFDPHLPGLAAAAHPHRVRGLLDRLGIGPGVVTVVPVTYRASRRAVLEVRRVPASADDVGPTRLFLKVVPPSRTHRIADVHQRVAQVVRAPLPLLADATEGTLLLSEVPGRSLRAVMTDPAAPLPPATAVVDLQRHLATVRTGLAQAPVRPFDVDRAADGLTAILPDHAERIASIAAVANGAADPDDPLVTIHGDLHEGQVVVADDGTLGLVDLDGTGPGALLDDAATVLAHAVLVQRWHPPTADRTSAWSREYLRAVEDLVDADRVRRRAAGVLLGLAAGSFAAGDVTWRDEGVARLDLATGLAGLADVAGPAAGEERATVPGEKTLIRGSSASQAPRAM